MFLIAVAFITIPAYQAVKQMNSIEAAKSAIQIKLKNSVRALWPGLGGGTKYYTTAITPLTYENLKKVSIKVTYYPLYPLYYSPVPVLPPVFVGWVIAVHFWIYDEATGLLQYEGFFDEIADKPYSGTTTVHSVPSPFDANTYIYFEYYKVSDDMNQYTTYTLHRLEGKQATLTRFLKELKGTDISKPKYFHFAGHGGTTKDGTVTVPYLAVRDDNNPDKYTQLTPMKIYKKIYQNDLENIRVVYFAACYSLTNMQSNNYYDNFVMPILDRGGANAMIGFTGEVDSFVAYVFADKFYNHLLVKEEYITEAYENAKNELKDSTKLTSAALGVLGVIIRLLRLTGWTGIVINMVLFVASFVSSLWFSNQLSNIRLITKSDLN